MEILLNTANPIMIIVYTLIVSGVIFISKTQKKSVPLIILMIIIIGTLVFHSVSLDKINSVEEGLVSQTYHCIAVDLILLLLVFLSYLWVDDIVAKDKNLKSYDDSLSWFWNKI